MVNKPMPTELYAELFVCPGPFHCIYHLWAKTALVDVLMGSGRGSMILYLTQGISSMNPTA